MAASAKTRLNVSSSLGRRVRGSIWPTEVVLRVRVIERVAGSAMIRIAITRATFDAIAATLPFGSVSYKHVNERGERYVWLPLNVVDRLKAQRRPSEGYSDVILRLAKRSALRPSARVVASEGWADTDDDSLTPRPAATR